MRRKTLDLQIEGEEEASGVAREIISRSACGYEERVHLVSTERAARHAGRGELDTGCGLALLVKADDRRAIPQAGPDASFDINCNAVNKTLGLWPANPGLWVDNAACCADEACSPNRVDCGVRLISSQVSNGLDRVPCSAWPS